MRTDWQALTDILTACDEIAGFIDDCDYATFISTIVIQRAVMYNLIIAGEAANSVSLAIRQQYDNVRWSDAVKMRNVAAHDYDVISYDRIWATITGDVPVLRDQIAEILDRELPGDE